MDGRKGLRRQPRRHRPQGVLPYWYSAIPLLIWDRDLGFRERTATYWVTWGMFPLYAVLAGVYCFVRLLD